MSKEIIKYAEGSFMDYAGKQRQFVICGRLERVRNGMGMLSFGYSFCSPEDKYDYALGAKIALERTKKIEDSPRRMSSTSYGQLKALMNDLLQKEVEYASSAPGVVMPRYIDEKRKWEQNKEFKEALNTLTMEEQMLLTALREGTINLNKLLTIYEKCKQKC